MMGDPCIGQHSGHAYPCTNDEGLFITDADKRLSTSLPFPFSHLFQILSDPSPPKHTHTHFYTYTHSHTHTHTLTHSHTTHTHVHTHTHAHTHTHTHTHTHRLSPVSARWVPTAWKTTWCVRGAHVSCSYWSGAADQTVRLRTDSIIISGA